MAKSYDAIVIGAGQNGLTCACYLAAAGLRVLVLERYHVVGGMTLTEEVAGPGFWSDLHASGYQLANFSPVPADLKLHELGVELIEPEIPFAHAFPDGRAIAVYRDLEHTTKNIGLISPADAEACRQLFQRYAAERARIIEGFFSSPPSFADQAKSFAATPAGMEAYRFSLLSVRNWAAETFTSPEVSCFFASFAAFVGAAPDDAGGAEIAWLFASVLQSEGNNFVRGGMNNVTRALATYLTNHGGEVRTSASVARILVTNQRATGVELENGEIINASLVVSAADPRQLIERFLGPAVAGPELSARIRNYEWGDAACVLFTALDGPLDYAAGPEAGAACHVHLTHPSLGAISQAFIEARSGLLPATPVIVAWNDTVVDPSRAPAGKHLKKFVVLGVPYDIAGDATGRISGRDWDAIKDAYADYLIDNVITQYLPDLRRCLIRRVMHSPRDLERTLSSAVRGTILHGAMKPYQMGSQRPVSGLGEYRTPVPNVYICDSGTHPGPGVSMGSGYNAACVISQDLGLPFPATRQA
jgi:phytoene dehydrogenase-like protein